MSTITSADEQILDKTQVEGSHKEEVSHKETDGTKILVGDPKKAIVKLAMPTFVAMLSISLYNLADMIWVSGLGTNAVAGVGFYLPFYLLMMSITAGIGVGGGALVSQMIGAKDKKQADKIANHVLILIILFTLLYTIPLYYFLEDILIFMGAGESFDYALSYCKIIIAFSFFLFFNDVIYALMRCEGEAKRAMYFLVFCVSLNCVLDPIFIYTLNMGIDGAAWASVVSIATSSVFLLFRYMILKSSYLSFSLKRFTYNKKVMKNIFKLGFPTFVFNVMFAVSMLLLLTIIAKYFTDSGVAVFTAGNRYIYLVSMPVMSIGTAVVAVIGAAYGASDLEKIKVGYRYALKLGVSIELVLAVLTLIFAPYISKMFTWSSSSAGIESGITLCLMISLIAFPLIPFEGITLSMFLGLGKSSYALILVFIRYMVFGIPLALFFCIYYNIGLKGIWIANVISVWGFAIIAYTWAVKYVNKLEMP